MLTADGLRDRNVMNEGCRTGFDAKERGRVIRIFLGQGATGPLLWTWRSREDVDAGRATEIGQDTVASSGTDAYDYCASMRVKNPESDHVLELLRSLRGPAASVTVPRM